MSSHYRNLTVEEMNKATENLSKMKIPRVKSAKEAEGRTREMSKSYLTKKEVKKKTLSERKGVSMGVLLQGSKRRNIKRMSSNEASNREVTKYHKKRAYQDQKKDQGTKE